MHLWSIIIDLLIGLLIYQILLLYNIIIPLSLQLCYKKESFKVFTKANFRNRILIGNVINTLNILIFK